MKNEKFNHAELVFQYITNTSPNAVVLVNIEGKLEYINSQTEKLLGYTQSELIDFPIEKIVPTLDDKLIRKIFSTSSLSQFFKEEKYLLALRKDMISIPIEIELNLVMTEESPLIIAFIKDHKENEKILSELKESQEKFKKAFDASPAGMAITKSSDTTFIEVNDAFLKMIGYSKEEVIGRSSTQIGMIVDALERQKVLTQLIENGSVQNAEMKVKIKSGKEFNVLTSIETISLKEEKCFLTIHHDITDRTKAEEDLRDKTKELALINKELEQFIYIASHDLQEPLRTVSNYIQIFEEDYYNILDENAQKCLNSINQATKRMSSLVKTLLDFSRLGRDKELNHVDIRALIYEVIADLNTMIGSSESIIKVGEMPKLNVYATEIRQLFQNLISNAIKFRKKDTKPIIEIHSEKINEKWRFSVRDNGIGIMPNHFDRIFNIFQRLHTSEEFEGNGIGLANCKKIIELHHGEIWVESNLGIGATFYFTL